MKESTKTIIELAISNDDQVDCQIARLIKNALNGSLPEQVNTRSSNTDEPLLLPMNKAAKKLGVSRVTFWRMVNVGTIKPIEIFEGVFRYNYSDLVGLSQQRSKYAPKARGMPSNSAA